MGSQCSIGWLETHSVDQALSSQGSYPFRLLSAPLRLAIFLLLVQIVLFLFSIQLGLAYFAFSAFKLYGFGVNFIWHWGMESSAGSGGGFLCPLRRDSGKQTSVQPSTKSGGKVKKGELTDT